MPASLPGDGGELGLGVHRHRVPGRFEHRQVAGGVGVRHALLEVEMDGPGEVGHDRGSSLTRRRGLEKFARVAAVPFPSSAQITSSNRGRSGSITRSSAPVIRSVLCPRPSARGPGGSGRERLHEDEVAEQLPAVAGAAGPRTPGRSGGRNGGGSRPGPCGRGPADGAPPEGAQHEAGPFGVALVTGCQPGVGVDHVGGDKGVLEVEDGQLTFGREDRPPATLLPAQAGRPPARAHRPARRTRAWATTAGR